MRLAIRVHFKLSHSKRSGSTPSAVENADCGCKKLRQFEMHPAILQTATTEIILLLLPNANCPKKNFCDIYDVISGNALFCLLHFF